MREELLAHVTAIYEEEYVRLNDSAAAMNEAARRFGNPVESTPELRMPCRAFERFGYYLDRWLGWRVPETAARWMLRLATRLFCMLALMCVGQRVCRYRIWLER